VIFGSQVAPPESMTPVANNGENIRLLTPKVNFEGKIYLYVNSATQRCQKNIVKTFLVEDFFHLPLVSITPVVRLELQVPPRISEKIQNGQILSGFGETNK
jgi:hypothetical protein